MTKKKTGEISQETAPSTGRLLVYQSDNGQVRVDVRLEGETVWLTQQQMVDLFQTTKQNISLHVQNIFAEGELAPQATVKKYLTVRQEGGRLVQRELEYYNLDMIISVGYRVKSAVATSETAAAIRGTDRGGRTFYQSRRRAQTDRIFTEQTIK
ncbi:MAG: hypothetical protein FD159_1273 [Syntrophaceae bacterium]|nr:MAG: hypothetical protein FD159_1273 [Syntrophaceae bacterium]